MLSHRRSARLIAAVLAAVTGLSIAPLAGTASAADQLPPLANPLAANGFCAGAPSTNPFSDLGAESATTRQVILCLVATELTSGTTATTFTPGGTVTRRQMALFIKRTADLFNELETGSPDLDELPDYDGQPDYSDVAPETAAFEEAIGQLTQAEIVGGLGDGTFRPGAPVSRRQMAAFINRLQDFLTGSPYTTGGDFFDDDEGDSGEANLNALASVGIFQGDGRGNVDPGGLLTRRQMANILLRNAQVQLAAGRIERPFTSSNQVLRIVEQNAETKVYLAGVNGTTPEDDRTYTASSLPASTGGYRVTLVDSDNISQSGGRTTFAEEGTTGLADAGTVAARIVAVNGTAVTAAQSVGAIQPVNGTITFTIDGSGTESVTPVIYTDGGANTRLELNDANQPAEAFGLGGATTYIPAEAADGSPASGDVLLEGPDFAALDTGSSEATVYFVTGDTYRIGSSGSFQPADAATFRARLSAGDSLSTCATSIGLPAAYSATGPNEYCLEDVAPASPTNLTVAAGTPRDTARRLTWTAAPSADTYNVYANAKDEGCSTTTLAELAVIAQVPATTTEYMATGLAPSTTHCFVVTTVEDGDESVPAVGSGANDGDNTAQGTTHGVIERPKISSAVLTTDAVQTGGATTGDVITLTFSERMDADTVPNATFSVTDADGDTTTIRCYVSAPPTPDPAPTAGDGVTLAECALGNGADATVQNDTLTLTLAENGDDANVQGANDKTIQYPLTITASSVLEDNDDGESIDVAASPDKTIS